MQMGIYKPGQGYWVRVLTAIGAAICFGAAALWAWQQAGAIRVPTPRYELTLGSVEGTIPSGEIVKLLREGATGDPEEMGSALIEHVAPGQGSVVVDSIAITDPEHEMNDTVAITLDSGRTLRVTGRRGIPLFEVLYLQAGVAGAIVLMGAFVTYYFVGAHRRAVEFLIATDSEMKKVNWSTWKDIRGSTLVVIVAALLLTSGLFAVDMGFSVFFRWIGVLTN